MIFEILEIDTLIEIFNKSIYEDHDSQQYPSGFDHNSIHHHWFTYNWHSILYFLGKEIWGSKTVVKGWALIQFLTFFSYEFIYDLHVFILSYLKLILILQIPDKIKFGCVNPKSQHYNNPLGRTPPWPHYSIHHHRYT